MPLDIHPGAGGLPGVPGLERPSGISPLGRLLESAGQTGVALGSQTLAAEKKRQDLESKLLIDDRYTQAVLEMDEFNSLMSKDPSIGVFDGGGTTKPSTAFGKFYEKGTKSWYKGLNDLQSAELDRKLLVKSLEYKTKAQGLSDKLLVDYAKKTSIEGGYLAEKAAATNPFSMEDPTGFYARTLERINVLEENKVIDVDTAAQMRTTLTKQTSYAAAGAMIEADPETYQALASGAVVQFAQDEGVNRKMNEQAKRVISNLDGSQKLQLDRRAQQTIEHRATKDRVAEEARLKKEERERKTIVEPFQAKLWEDAMKPGANVAELMDQAFAAGPAGPGLPGPGDTNVRLNATELNHMRTTLESIARGGATKSDPRTLQDFYVDLDSGGRYTPSDYAQAHDAKKLTDTHFTSLVSAWHARRNTDRAEARADLRQARNENRRQIDKFFDVEGLTEVFTEERKLLWLQANSEWITKSSSVSDPIKLDQIRQDLIAQYEPQMKGKIRDEVTKAKVYTYGYETLADLEADIQAGTVRGIDPRSPRQVNDLRNKVKRYEELARKAEIEKKKTEGQKPAPSRSNPLRKLFGGSE